MMNNEEIKKFYMKMFKKTQKIMNIFILENLLKDQISVDALKEMEIGIHM